MNFGSTRRGREVIPPGLEGGGEVIGAPRSIAIRHFLDAAGRVQDNGFSLRDTKVTEYAKLNILWNIPRDPVAHMVFLGAASAANHQALSRRQAAAVGIIFERVSPTGGENSLDPAFQDGRCGPPPHGKHHGEGIAAFETSLFPQYIRRRPCTGKLIDEFLLRHDGLKTFTVEVCKFDLVSTACNSGNYPI